MIELEDLRNRSMRSILIFKNIHEEKDLTWEDTAKVLGKFINEELDMNYTHEEFDMYVSRAHRGSQHSSKSNHRGPRPLLTQFTNCGFAEEVRTSVIKITSKRRLSLYITKYIAKN